ncbi:MAG: aspartyl protease family protein [Treponema sp.]|jgi:predicted aspartyl protease|nr:aspartyl protease family protein [Treponema sp.]
MGEAAEKITLVNSGDISALGCGYIQETEVRQLTVDAIADTCAMSLVMGKETCKRLGLVIEEDREATLAGGVRQACKVTEPVTIRWNERYTATHALVLPGKEEILLGVIPLEGMDLMVNPVEGCLADAHGDAWVRYVR